MKEEKDAITWTRLWCQTFAADAVGLQHHALAHNVGDLMRTLAMPKAAESWLLTSLREKLIKIRCEGQRCSGFRLAEVSVSRPMLPAPCF